MNNEQFGENNNSKSPKAKESESITELVQQMTSEEVAQAVREFAQNRSSVPRNWQPGHQLKNGKYIIEEKLGSGGFGITYLATDNQGEQVVIKILKDELQSRDDFNQLEEDFVNEAMKLSKFNHPNIVPIIEVIYYESNWCIVMKYIEGKTLEDLVEEQGSYLSPKEALHYIKQIGEALKAVHAHGLLHKDVKPQNIIIEKERSVAVLIDFGLALKFDGNPVKNISRLTHGYAPIEQYETIVTWGYYTDVYALAATLYFMLTKEKPIPAKKRAGGAKLVPAKELNKAISEQLNDAINKGMSLEPASRPETVEKWLALINKTPVKTPAVGWTILLVLVSLGLALSFVVLGIIDNKNRRSYPPILNFNGEPITNELTTNKTCNILSKKYCDKYIFTGRKGDKINIEMSSNEIDPHLILIEPGGNELAEMDDISVNNSNAIIEAELPVNGDYIVIAQSSQEQEVGKYTLRASKK